MQVLAVIHNASIQAGGKAHYCGWMGVAGSAGEGAEEAGCDCVAGG